MRAATAGSVVLAGSSWNGSSTSTTRTGESRRDAAITTGRASPFKSSRFAIGHVPSLSAGGSARAGGGYLAEQLGNRRPVVRQALHRPGEDQARHAGEIQRQYGMTPFAEVEPELTAWIADQTVDDRRGSEGHLLRGGGVVARPTGPDSLGVTTLERMIAAGREAADRRSWRQLTSPSTPQTSGALLRLLDLSDVGEAAGQRAGSPAQGSFPHIVEGHGRRAEQSGGPGRGRGRVAGRVDGPAALVARAGDARHCGQDDLLRRMPREHRLAVLVATVLALSARATDDASGVVRPG